MRKERTEMATIMSKDVNTKVEPKVYDVTTLVNLTGFTIVVDGKTIRPKMGPVVRTASGGIARYPLVFGSLALSRKGPDGRKEFVRNEKHLIQLDEKLAPRQKGTLYICNESTAKLFIGREDYVLFVPDNRIDWRGECQKAVTGLLTKPVLMYVPVDINLAEEEELPLQEDDDLLPEDEIEEVKPSKKSKEKPVEAGLGNFSQALDAALEGTTLGEEIKEERTEAEEKKPVKKASTTRSKTKKTSTKKTSTKKVEAKEVEEPAAVAEETPAE